MKKILALILALMMVLSMVACGAKEEPKEEAKEEAAAETKEETKEEAKEEEKEEAREEAEEAPAEAKDTLVVQYGPEPEHLDQHQTALMTTSLMTPSLHSKLVTLEGGEIVGDLAESWAWNADYTQLTFQLKEGLKFSDGSDLTAEDVVWTFQLNKDEGYGFAFLAYIDSMEAPSATEVIINLTQPCTTFLSALTTGNFSVYSKAAIEGGMDVAKLPNITSGAYYVDEWIIGEKIILKANENYHLGAPAIKTVEMLFMTDENTALVAFESGDIDVITGSGTSITASSIEHIESLGKGTLVPYSSAGYFFMVMNQSVEYFADANVRKAIDLVVNRDDIIAVACDGNGAPAGIPVREGIGGYVEGHEPATYDAEAAKALMAESAYPDGFTFTAMVPGSNPYKKAAEVVQMQLAEIGITMEITETDTGTISTAMTNNAFEASFWSWTNASGDISNITDIYNPNGPKCYAKYTDTSINDMMVESATVDGDARAEILDKAYTAIEDMTPYIGLFWPTNTIALQEGLTMSGEMGILGSLPLATMSWN